MIPAANGSDDRVGGGGPFRRVLVAWDGSPDSVAALNTAAALVGGSAGHVVALAVLHEHPPVEGGAALEDGKSEEADRMMEDFTRARASITTRSRARIDLHTTAGHQIGRSLCAYATEHGFDLLVVGRHGDGGVLHPRLGRVAEAAVKASKVPVLLVSRD